MFTQKITDPDTKQPIDIQFENVGEDGIHIVDAKFPVDDKIISFQFIEKFKVSWEQNLIRRISRTPYMEENSKTFQKAFSEAYRKFQDNSPIYYVYRHYGPMNKLGYTNSKLIGCTTNYDKINSMMKKDYEEFVDKSNQEWRFTYSISIGDFFVTNYKNK